MPHTSSSFACVSATPARRWRGMGSASGLVAAAALALSAGCTSPQHSSAAGPVAAAPATGTNAVGAMPVGHARLLSAQGAPAGTARLQAVQGGVEIVLQVQGMAPGTHGFHIHAQGECAPAPDAKTGKMVAFGAAGGHFDPYGTQTHGHPGQSPHAIHAGDVPNLVVDASGQGTLRYTHTGVTLTPGQTSIAGRSLVVHESADDYTTNPAGNSGPRIACGVILMTPANLADATPPASRWERFPILAGYIFGKNKGERKLPMTAPVTQVAVPVKLEMTAPVQQSAAPGGFRVQFVLPRGRGRGQRTRAAGRARATARGGARASGGDSLLRLVIGRA